MHPATNALRWRVGFTADGETLVLSSGGATESEVEKLVTYRADDTLGNGGMPTPMPNGENVTRWTLSADGRKIFFFKEYNYNAMGNQSGTLDGGGLPQRGQRPRAEGHARAGRQRRRRGRLPRAGRLRRRGPRGWAC